jgi:trigger factor
LNIKVERIENHNALMTVEISAEQMADARQKAMRKVGAQVSIPGFRKGKAPAHILQRYIGEGAIMEEAIEFLAKDLYPKALDESKLTPCAPGAITNVHADPLALEFTVPLEAEVELDDYRDARIDYNEPVITDEDFEKTMKSLLEREATYSDSTDPAKLMDRVHLDIKSVLLPKANEQPAEGEAKTDEQPAEGEATAEERYFDQKNYNMILDTSEEMMAPGFIEAIVGMTVDEERKFTLTLSDSSEDYGDAVNRQVAFEVKLNRVENMTLPDMDDAFAARLTAKEENPLTLEQLRTRVRNNMESQARKKYEEDYRNRVLGLIVAQATIHMHETVIREQIVHMLKRFSNGEANDREIEKMIESNPEFINNIYRPSAVDSLSRMYVIREIIEHEQLKVENEDIIKETEAIIAEMGEKNRSMLQSQPMQLSIMNQLYERRAYERIVAIGKGEAPELETSNS